MGQGDRHMMAARLGCERVLTKLSDKEFVKIHDGINFDFYARLSHIFVDHCCISSLHTGSPNGGLLGQLDKDTVDIGGTTSTHSLMNTIYHKISTVQ